MAETGSSVYLYYSGTGVLVYVGVTDRGTRRMHEHADSKPWWPLVTGCAIEHYGSREDALARERECIQRFRPAFNFQHNPDRDLPYEAKVAKVGGARSVPGVFIPEYAGLRTLKDRRRFFYTLSPEQKRLFPCVQCGMRASMHGRPSCASCRTAPKTATLRN